MEHFRENLLSLWIAVDGTGWLRIARDGAVIRTTVWRAGAVQADRRVTTWQARTPGMEASGLASKRLDCLSVELGDPGLGPTYRLYVAAESTDPTQYGGKQWRPVLPEDAAADVRLFPEYGASYYEALLGKWDDFVEDINAGEEWVYPLSTWRPASPAEARSAPAVMRAADG